MIPAKYDDSMIMIMFGHNKNRICNTIWNKNEQTNMSISKYFFSGWKRFIKHITFVLFCFFVLIHRKNNQSSGWCWGTKYNHLNQIQFFFSSLVIFWLCFDFKNLEFFRVFFFWYYVWWDFSLVLFLALSDDQHCKWIFMWIQRIFSMCCQCFVCDNNNHHGFWFMNSIKFWS